LGKLRGKFVNYGLLWIGNARSGLRVSYLAVTGAFQIMIFVFTGFMNRKLNSMI